MTTLAQTLARYARAGDTETIPGEVRREGTRALLNWFGCALGGSTADLLHRALAVADRQSGPREASVIGHARRVDVAHAAFVNCLSSALHAFDDTHLVSVAHPTGPVAAACLAMAEQQRASGSRFLRALIVGMEVECRMGCLLMQPPGDCSVGWTMNGLVGGIGAAAGLGGLLGLDEGALVSALGIAATQAGGFRENVGSMSRDLPMAQAARAGVDAALLAREGFTSSARALDGPRGFAHLFAKTPNLDAATRDLGRRYEMMSNSYKPYPCGIVIHPIIDVCLALAVEHDLDAARIERVELTVNPDAITVTGLVDPVDGLGAQISAPHWAAAALARRRAGFEEASDAAAVDPALVALRRRVRLIADPALARDAATGTVVLADGTRLAARVDHCVGSVTRPMTDAQLEAKLRMQARGVVSDAAASRLIAFCWNVEGVSDIGSALRAVFA